MPRNPQRQQEEHTATSESGREHSARIRERNARVREPEQILSQHNPQRKARHGALFATSGKSRLPARSNRQ